MKSEGMGKHKKKKAQSSSLNCHSPSTSKKTKERGKDKDRQHKSTDDPPELQTEVRVDIKKVKKKKRKREESDAHDDNDTACDLPSKKSCFGQDSEDQAFFLEEPPQKKKKKKKNRECAVEFETESTAKTKHNSKKKKHKLKERILTNRASGDEDLECLGSKATEKTNFIDEAESGKNNEESVRKKEKQKKKKKQKNLIREINEVEEVDSTQQEWSDVNETPDVEDLDDLSISEFQKEQEESAGDDAKQLEQLKEFLPNMDSKYPVNASVMIRYDLPRFLEFKKKGIPIRYGRFTETENAVLRKNVEDFLVLVGLDCATKLFFTHRYSEEKQTITKLKRLHTFIKYIAEGIPRPCLHIYARGRKMFDEQNYMGRFSASEIQTLRKLYTLYGNNWKMISELTGRSPIAVQKRYAQLCENAGAWSKAELSRLIKAVRNYVIKKLPESDRSNTAVSVEKEMLYKGLPWQDISAKVKTRSWTQCRGKWMYILAERMSHGSISTKKRSLEIKIKLIKGIYEMEIEDFTLINWDDLTAVTGNLPPGYLQRKWHKLRVCNVPEYRSKSFADTIDFLYEKVLPNLERKFSDYSKLNEVQESQERVLLTDIFEDAGQGPEPEEAARGES